MISSWNQKHRAGVYTVMKLWTLLLVVGLTVQAAPQAIVSDAATREDVQAIYSKFLPPTNPTFLIADALTPLVSPPRPHQPIESCINLPRALATNWAEIVASARAAQSSKTFPTDLKLPRPYKVLTASEVQEFRDERVQSFARAIGNLPLGASSVLPPSTTPKFAGATSIFHFSDVFFDKDRKIAVVSVNDWSGPIAASWRWHVLERANGRWEERPQWACPGPVAALRQGYRFALIPGFVCG